MSREVKRYAVMEYHRKKWIPILSKEEGKPRVITISEESAEMMNLDAEAAINEKGRTSLFGYFPVDAKKKEAKPKKEVKTENSIEVLREQYKEVFGKKPFAGWNEEKLIEKIEAKK